MYFHFYLLKRNFLNPGKGTNAFIWYVFLGFEGGKEKYRVVNLICI